MNGKTQEKRVRAFIASTMINALRIMDVHTQKHAQTTKYLSQERQRPEMCCQSSRKQKRQLFVLKKLNINQLTNPGVCAFGKFDWLTASVNQNNTIGQKITNRHLVQLDSFSQKVIFILKTFKKCGWWVVVVVGGGKKLVIFVVYLYAKS